MTYLCGNCGASFDTKGAKKRHKLAGCQVADADDDYGDEDRYTRIKHITPAIKARADAEWAAMDWKGRLPKGWTYEAKEASNGRSR